MAKNVNAGYVPANPFQCPTNIVKPKKCDKCAKTPICKKVSAPITGTIVGFKHTAYREYEGCLKPVDGIVYFDKPIDTSVEGAEEALYKAICAKLMWHRIPQEEIVNPDVCEIVLECNIILDVSLADGITHISQGTEIILVDDAGVEIPNELFCKQVDVCEYEAQSAEELTEESVAADLAVEGITADSIVVTTNDDTGAYIATIKVTDTKIPSDLLVGGKSLIFCGCECDFIAEEEGEKATEQKQPEPAKAKKAKAKTEKK